MSEDSQPVSSTETKPKKTRKPSGFALYKQRKEAEIAALKAKLADAPVEIAAVGPGAYNAARDPLRAITADTRFVDFIGNSSTYYLRPSMGAYNPPIAEISVTAHKAGRWAACPFEIGSRDRITDENMKVMLDKWWHIRISREQANAVYGDDRWPCPMEAVVAVNSFSGVDFAKNPTGEYVRLPDRVPLREVTRILLQRNPGTLFLSYSSTQPWVDARYPNPYGNFIDGQQRIHVPPDEWPEAARNAPLPAYPGQTGGQ